MYTSRSKSDLCCWRGDESPFTRARPIFRATQPIVSSICSTESGTSAPPLLDLSPRRLIARATVTATFRTDSRARARASLTRGCRVSIIAFESKIIVHAWHMYETLSPESIHFQFQSSYANIYILQVFILRKQRISKNNISKSPWFGSYERRSL